jgi:putative drug exporter of the RND superfamily
VLVIPLPSVTLGQPDNGTNPTSDSGRKAYDLISQGFAVGVNGARQGLMRYRLFGPRR